MELPMGHSKGASEQPPKQQVGRFPSSPPSGAVLFFVLKKAQGVGGLPQQASEDVQKDIHTH